MIQVLSNLQKHALSLDYSMIPTLLFSPDIQLKSCQSCHLQLKLGFCITWSNFQTLQLALPLVWYHGKFTRLTFNYMTEFLIRINKMINLLFCSPLSPVSPMSHGWPSTRTKYLTEENCLPHTASVSLASSVDSCVLSLEPLENLFQSVLLVGSHPPRCRFPLIPLNLKDGFVYIYPSESLLLCKYLKLRPPWEGTHNTEGLAFLFLQNIHKIAQRFPGVCFWVLYKQLLLQRGKETSRHRNINAHSFLREFQNSKLLKYQGKRLVSLQA